MRTISIVHIDDNAGDLTLAREALSGERHIAYEGIDEPVAAIGKLGRDCAAGTLPTVILLDLNLAGMSGLDVLRLLASNRALKRVPVIVLTSSDRDQEREECLRLGAASVVVKPATFEELQVVLTSAIAGVGRAGPRKAAAAGADGSMP
jgi:CheY-like chemotaxis protein